MDGFFITGTDTGVGKTWASIGLLELFNQQGLTTIAMKPVASGCEQTPEGLRNDDAQLLIQVMTAEASYDEVNPYAYAPAIAPHLAALKVGETIDLDKIIKQANKLSSRADRIVIEGAGGWLVPLNSGKTFADLAVALNLPVVLVVAIRLGCINHALLSVESIKQRGLTIAGWIANTGTRGVEDCGDIDANIKTLSDRIHAPLLGVLPLLKLDATNIANQITISPTD